jgi:PAS domain S-box-containing protein
MERGGKAILQATVRDITERKNAQAAAEESERRYRLLIEQSVDGIIVADGRWDIQFVNPAICRMLGYTPEELCQLNIAETGIPEERDKVARQRQALRAGSIVRYERNIRKKDGSCFPVEVIIGQMDDGRYQEIVRDITERKRTQEALQKREAHYRALVETTHTGFVVVDHEGKVLDANAEYVRLTGHRDLNEIRGRSVLEWTAAHEK